MAEKDIIEISRSQESSYEKICSILKVRYPRKISYWFYNTPEILGKYLCNGNPCNGLSLTDEKCSDIGSTVSLDGNEDNSFIVPAYSIHAVYDESIKCIGEHEDTHMIAAYINEPSSDFLCEGLAMFMDGKWWGEPNRYWVSQFLQENICPKPSEIIEISEDEFWEIETKISYPLAGAWVEFLTKEYGIEIFLNIYSHSSEYIKVIEKETNNTIEQIDERFFDWVLLDNCN